MLKVNEIFTSIQGEGVHTGVPMRFVRFSGCDMECDFCDTDHSNSIEVTRNWIVRECKGHTHVCLTGGEPTIQKDLDFLIALLISEGHLVHLETNGRHAVIPRKTLWITCSPKLKSGESIMQLPGLRVADEVKILSPTISCWRCAIVKIQN